MESVPGQDSHRIDCASLPKGPALAPGGKYPLVVVITEPDGKTLQTEGAGQGKVMWKDLTVTASVVNASQKGIVSLPKDPRISDRQYSTKSL